MILVLHLVIVATGVAFHFYRLSQERSRHRRRIQDAERLVSQRDQQLAQERERLQQAKVTYRAEVNRRLGQHFLGEEW